MNAWRIISATLLCAALAIVVAAADVAEQPGNKYRGVLVAHNGNSLTVKGEGQKESRRFTIPPESGMDATTVRFFRELQIGSDIEVTIKNDRGGPWATYVLLVAKPGKFGLISGTITDKAPTAKPEDTPQWIQITDDDEHSEQYMPPWTGKEFDPAITRAFVERSAGDRVEVRWTDDEHRRAVTLRILAFANPPAGDDGGTFVGKVIEKGKDYLLLREDGGQSHRYVPQHLLGGTGAPDKEMQRAIAAAKVGKRLEAEWYRVDSERWLYGLKEPGK